jgi:hypothetical protein
MRTHI